jgi:amino acid adenylation domain-containing protein
MACVTVFACLEAQAKQQPEAPAILSPDRTLLTYARLVAHVRDIATRLRAWGIERNDRVALVLPNGPEMAVAFLSTACVATSAPLNPAYRQEELDFYLTDLRARALIVDARSDSPAREVARKRGIAIIELTPQPEQPAGIFTLSADRPQASVEPDWAQEDDTALVLHTSGTTARPKIVPLTQRNLCASAYNIITTLHLTPQDRCLNVMPLFHIHGLLAALLATHTAGASVVCTPCFAAQKFFGWLEQFHATWYTAVPTMHQAVCEQAKRDGREWHGLLRFIRSSSAALPPQLMQELERLFAAPVIEAYGMTEAAHQMASNPLPPAQRKPGSVGLPAGPHIAIMDDAGQLLAQEQKGEIVIRGGNVTQGYENNPEANAKAFTTGWFRTGDQGYFDADGYLFLTSRLKEIINRGGEKVTPREVDEAMLDHPAVAQAVTFAVPHPTLGEDVAVAVVLRAGATTTAHELRQFVLRKLAIHKSPSQVVIVPAIPKGPTGKVQRIGLYEKLAAQMKATFVAPGNSLEESLARIWCEVLGSEKIGVNDNFFALGGQSLLATQVISRIRRDMQVEIPLRSLFEYPTVAGLAGVFASISLEDKVSLPPIEPVSRGINLPLSFAQERMWFIEQLYPANTAYNTIIAIRLTGALDARALEQSINLVVARHEILRTTFTAVDGLPRQVIAPHLPLSIEVKELRSLPEHERERGVQQAMREEADRPFDLAQGPLLRLFLWLLSDTEQVFLYTIHHIISDGWSQAIFVRELGTLYQALAGGKQPSLPELPIQYADFAVWQRDWLRGAVLEKQLAYWRKQLHDLPVLTLPAAHPRPAQQTFHGRQLRFVLPRELREGLLHLSRQQGMTMFMASLTAFHILLNRYTQQEDIAVASPIANRNRSENEGLLGFFANTLVLRANLAENPSCQEMLQRVRQVTLDAYMHQDLPFEKLIAELQPVRDRSRNPLAQILFTWRNERRISWEVPGLQLSHVAWDSGQARFDLELYIGEDDEKLACYFIYNTDLFEAATIERMAGHFHNILQGMVADPGQRIGEIPMLGQEERRQLLVAWNDTVVAYPKDQCLHRLFEEQATRTPEATAVIWQDESLTYRDLNRRANQLAHYLQQCGIGPDACAGICIARSPDMVIGVLAILKAGGAYVPLDPTYPKERLAFMLQDAGISVLLTQSHLLPALPAFAGRIICCDTMSAQFAGESCVNPQSKVGSDHLAYLIYTSGSTGKPKGVLIPHRNVVNVVWAIRQRPGIACHDRMLAVTTLSFDTAAADLFGSLLNGAAVVIVPRDTMSDGLRLGDTILETQATVMQATPVTWKLLLAAGWPQRSFLRMWCTGEALPPSLAHELSQRGGELWNLYGPTETTIWSCLTLVPAEISAIAIGRPLANTSMYILDSHLAPVPVGVTGELYIGGDGLARGYLNRPELTAERFIPNPFSEKPGERLYRTGDLARYLADGNIEFIGRSDQQVKIRGFRIEPGEIEAVICQCAGVREAVVLAREETPGDKRLVAYVVPQPATTFSAQALRAFLRQQLPDYMVPSFFVPLDKLPLTPNGKVNRQALPAPDSHRGERELHFVAPQTPVQEMLVGIWSEVLRAEKIGIHDEFFALGGHSLLAMRVISLIRNVLQVEIPVSSLFDHPTVAGLAEVVAACRDAATSQPAPPIRPVVRTDKLPLSFAQERLWFIEQLEPENTPYHIATAIRLTGRLDVQALEQGLHEMIRRHEVLRTHFVTEDGQPRQVISAHLAFALPVTDLRKLATDEQESALRQSMLTATHRQFDLTHDLLLRAAIYRIREDEHVLLYILHHIVSDGWSQEIFAREVGTLYQALVTGNRPSLPELPIQYADFAVWQRDWLRGEVLEKQLAYWREHLRGLSALALPADHPRQARQTFHGRQVRSVLPSELREGVQRLNRQQGMTMFMTLLTAFHILLSRYTQQEDIAVASPIANRNRSEIEGLIGFFANTLVLRANLAGNPSCQEMLQRVRKVALDAYMHQDLPFEKLVEELQPVRDLSRNPLAQILFTWRNDRRISWELPGLQLNPVAWDSGQVRFDLELHVGEDGEKLTGYFIYNTDLFEVATIERMAGHFQNILQGMVADPSQRIGEIPMLGKTEQQQLLIAWNDTAADYPRVQCLHRLFEEQAERTPEATAVIWQDESLSYRDLNRRANQLAHYLRKLGVGPELLVGICMDRSSAMLVGLLAILKAGGAYVPLDPAYPKDRLAFMLQDAGISVLLTQRHLLASLPEHHTAVVCVDSDYAQIAQYPQENPASRGDPQNPAYVIYTSGSTGQPKGVALPQGALVNLIRWQLRQSNLPQGAKTLQFTSLSFDVSFQEIFATWCAGGTLVVIEESIRRDAERLWQFLCAQQIARLFLPFVALQQLAETAAWQEKVASDLHEVVTAGEPLQCSPAIKHLFRSLPHCTLCNQYGPAESHVVTAYTLPHAQEGWASLPPIGKPIANSRIYLLDASLQPVPVGVTGELYIGGDGLARGYLNRPELTAERFIPDPFSEKQGERLYRTGDLARYLADGNIEFIGRSDQQVKIRGFRIEPGEIEAALCQCAGVRDAIVLAREESPGDKRLVAYVVLHQRGAVAVDTLRDVLKRKLPDYMVPAVFVPLDKLPLTPSGKVNRQALPAPDTNVAESSHTYVAPHTSLERELVHVWEEILRSGPIGVNDNFFDLGGHSLLIVQLAAKIKQHIGQNIPLAMIFQAPTVAQLAELLQHTSHFSCEKSLVPIHTKGKKTPLFWIHGSDGLHFIKQHLGAEQPLYWLKDYWREGSLPEDVTIEQIAAGHIEEIRAVQRQGPYFLGGYSLGGLIAFEIARQLQEQGQEVSLLFLLDSNSPYRSLIAQIMSHCCQLARLGFAGCTHYIWVRLKNRWIKGMARITRILYARSDCPLPVGLVYAQNSRIYHRCIRRYVPQPYTGKAVMWTTRNQKKMLALWHKWILGGIEIHELVADHLDLCQKPHVHHWLLHLQDCLERHQTDAEYKA